VIAAHRVQGDPHGLLLFLGFFFLSDHDATLKKTAIRANPMRQDRLVALLAVLNLNRANGVVRPPMALLGTGRTSLGNSHDSFAA
jgi:hypothetical protein